jgi:hypothetical protein
MSPLFHINYAGKEAWTAMKGLEYLDPKQICKISGLKAIYCLLYFIELTKDYQIHFDQSSIILLASSLPIFLFPL